MATPLRTPLLAGRRFYATRTAGRDNLTTARTITVATASFRARSGLASTRHAGGVNQPSGQHVRRLRPFGRNCAGSAGIARRSGGARRPGNSSRQFRASSPARRPPGPARDLGGHSPTGR